MRITLTRLAAALLLASAACAPAAAQRTVSLEGGAVTFELPEGFEELTPEQLARKYPAGSHAPRHAYAVLPGMSVSLAVTFSPANVTPEQLPQLKTAMEEMMPRLNSTIRWITREMVQIGGRTWVHFEFTSQAVDAPIHNHTFLTSFRGKMLGFNFNATQEQYERYRERMLRSSRSLRIAP